MRRARRLGGLLTLIAVAYMATPYFTLYRLGAAIRDGDAAALETLVDWDRVREGIKEDICDAAAEAPEAGANQAGDNAAKLPAFGESFMRGIAVNMIDQAVSAPALVQATRARPELTLAAADPASEPQPRITWAFFESATTFAVELQPPGPKAQPIRLELSLRDRAWRVTRAWLPDDLLTPAADRT